MLIEYVPGVTEPLANKFDGSVVLDRLKLAAFVPLSANVPVNEPPVVETVIEPIEVPLVSVPVNVVGTTEAPVMVMIAAPPPLPPRRPCGLAIAAQLTPDIKAAMKPRRPTLFIGLPNS